MHQSVRAVAVALALLAGGAAADEVTLTLPQAHDLARRAYAAGNAGLAHALALRLLEANPDDPRAHLIIAATAPALGRPAEGRVAGRAAWAAARNAPILRYEIARFTAKAALAEGRAGTAQLWLRRAADVAPDPDSAARTARDFTDLRNARAFSYALDVSAMPSSNLNGGAAGDDLTVNDTLPIGSLSGSAQALEGVRGTASARLAWRVSETARHRLVLGARGYLTVNRLSDAAAAQAPDIDGADLNLQTLEGVGSLDWRMGRLPRPLRLTFGAGRTWYGGDVLGDHLRGEVSYPVAQGARGTLRIGVGSERQWRDDGPLDAATLRLDGVRALKDGARATYALVLKDVTGTGDSDDHRVIAAEASLALARPLGPAELRLTVEAGARDYPFFALGPIGVTDGREDTFAALSVEAAFPGLARYGYMPKVTLTAEETWSNISRYQTRTVGVSFGFASQF